LLIEENSELLHESEDSMEFAGPSDFAWVEVELHLGFREEMALNQDRSDVDSKKRGSLSPLI
jgi:hypothetical protein